jgi:hypothetical protein
MALTPDFRLSSDSKALAVALAKVPVGETASYSSLTAAVGRDVQTTCRGALETARYIVQREDRMVFDVVRGVGLRRLLDGEIVDLSDRARDHARRHARRTVKKLICVDYGNLPRDKQTKHNAALSMFGVFSELASDKSQKRLETKIEQAGEKLPAAKAAMEALGAIS